MPDIRQLPGMVPPGFENTTMQVIAGQMEKHIEEVEASIQAGTAENESDENPVTRCSFTFHGQIDPLFVPQVLINEYEREMDDPSGLPLENLPKLRLNGVLMSEECGVLLELEDVTGVSYVYQLWTSITRSYF
jgi:transmembrane E3 ubiquitin-protein ligase